jgi:hypothetical protein
MGSSDSCRLKCCSRRDVRYGARGSCEATLSPAQKRVRYAPSASTPCGFYSMKGKATVGKRSFSYWVIHCTAAMRTQDSPRGARGWFAPPRSSQELANEASVDSRACDRSDDEADLLPILHDVGRSGTSADGVSIFTWVPRRAERARSRSHALYASCILPSTAISTRSFPWFSGIVLSN